MSMPPRAPAAGPITGDETVRIIQEGKPVLAKAAALSGSGPRGPAGSKGDTGAQGPTGIQGQTGDPGPTGPKGSKGDTGGQGVQGAVGPTGPKGDTGAQGAIGPVGATGPAGPTGAKGDAGPQGPQGAAGEKGDPGTPLRVETYTANSNASGVATFSFPTAFTAINDISVKIGWASDQQISGAVTANTLTGATVLVKRSRGTLLLTAGPFETAPNTPVTIVVTGR